MQTPQTNASSGGCLSAFIAVSSIMLSIATIGAVAQTDFVAGMVVAVVVILAWIVVSIWLRRRRAAKVRANLDAAALRQQQYYAAQEAEQRRLHAAQEAENQRQLIALQAEQDRQRLEREAEARRADEARKAAEEQARIERWRYLTGKYDEPTAKKIWDGKLWIDCSVDILVDMLGQPAAIDEKVLKTKTKHTYKYRPTGANRFDLRVNIENGRVVGWDDKSDG